MQPAESHGSGGAAVAVALLVLLVIGGLVLYLPHLTGGITGLGSLPSSSSTPAGTPSSNSTSTTESTQLVESPLITGGIANVSYPSAYQQLSSYSLQLINRDRADFNLSAVTLAPGAVAQQHADSMLYFGYLSHYDTQGYKPYMRYTLLGGVGAVEENVALESWSGPHYLGSQSVEAAIQSLEHSMMYNDSNCCNNGHRLNILDPFHNRVSIGVAYNATRAYFVEDFENYYADIHYNVTRLSVSMVGTLFNPSYSSDQMWVFFDPTPAPLNASALNSGPRQYDPGTLTGGVLPPCQVFCPYLTAGITAHASAWEFQGNQVDISFSLSPFVKAYGSGVYTLYLVIGSDTSTSLTSFSVFVS